MSGLQKFIGAREVGPELQGPTGEGSSHAGGKNERLQARMQEMGFTSFEANEVLSNPTRAWKPTDDIIQRRKKMAHEHRLKVPTNFVSGKDTSAGGIGHRNDPTSGAPRAAQGLPEEIEDALPNRFDTDAESLEITSTFGDFTGSRAERTSLRGIGRFDNSLDQVHRDTYDNGQISLITMEPWRRRVFPSLDQLDPNGLVEDAEECEYDGSRSDSSDEEQPERDRDSNYRIVEDSVIQGHVRQLGNATNFRSCPTKPKREGEGNIEPSRHSPIDSPGLGQDVARRNNNEPQCTSVVRIASKSVSISALNAELHGKVQGRPRQLPNASPKQGQVHPNANVQYDSTGQTWLLQAGMSEDGTSNNYRLPDGDRPQWHSPAIPARLLQGRDQVPWDQTINAIHAASAKSAGPDVATSHKRVHDSGELPFVSHGSNSDARDEQDIITSNIRKRAPDLDYTPSQLLYMTYDQLSSESFDDGPYLSRGNLPDDLADTPLAQRLQFVYNLKHDEKQYLQRQAIFSSLTIDQYEECGDILIQRLGEIMSRYTDARRQKRKVASEFEKEVARREERVRGKKETVDGDLRRLRRAGEDVVRGKENY